jgi:ubiquinol-cytochrome c reductase cytochrome b/c1 subunit
MATSSFQPKNKMVKRFDRQLPILSLLYGAVGPGYPSPKNLNYWWNFGSLAGLFLVVQILTGIILAMHYVPDSNQAFDSVEHLMRDVNYGWLLRYMHANGASMFFLVVYVHIFRGLYYGSYKHPREVLWFLGLIIYLLMMATGFMGYVLPWGQMSFWAAKVITNLFSSVDMIIPGVGTHIVEWLWGGFSVGQPTLNRFFSLHYLLPFLIVGVVILHIWALHIPGSNNPLGIDVKGPQDQLPFHPYYTAKDAFGVGVALILFAFLIFYAPDLLGHSDNYIKANPLQTPPHIVPEWYYLPFYAILRSIPNKLLGVIALFVSILILFAMPWLDRSKVRSARFRPVYKVFFWVLLVDVLVLGHVGSQPPDKILFQTGPVTVDYVLFGQIFTFYYFLHFFVLVPLIGIFEKPKPLPESISKAVLKTSAVATILAVVLLGVTGGGHKAMALESELAPAKQTWPHSGAFGQYDRAAVQRGFQVYKEVCHTCHSLNYFAFRNLTEVGFSEDQAKAIAAEFMVEDGPNDDGDMYMRPGRLADHMPAPFANDVLAKASNGGALPPDLSVMVKAREHHEDYIFALLTHYGMEPPEDVTVLAGLNYNPYFSGDAIAMPQPLQPELVEYADGTPATLEQEAHDVVTFLAWVSEPKLEQRHEIGFRVMVFLVVFTILLYFVKKRIWSRVDH